MGCSKSKATTAGLYTAGASGASSSADPSGTSSSSSAAPLVKDKRTSLQQKSVPAKDVKAGGFGTSQFILNNEGKVISEFYEIAKQKLGEGSYGSVCKGINKSTRAVRAVKTIPKAHMAKNLEKFYQEIAIMKIVDHPNIVKLHETFEDHKNVYLVMELLSGGELFDRILEAGHFDEVQAAILMQQIIRAIFYLHENHICHRDLKPENFLFSSKEPIELNLLKIIDFGLSCKFEPGQFLVSKAGTPYYVAPQVLQGKYDQQSDLWSCGAIMYLLLCGYPPFFGETDAEVLSKVRLGNFSFNPSDWKHISEDAKDLIRMLLKLNPKERYNAEMALNHEWIKNKAPKAKGVCLQANFVENLRGFRAQGMLKKAALHIIAGQLKEEHLKGLRETFMAMDNNGDGQLTVEEMREGIQKAGIKDLPSDLQQIMEEVDSDGSGVIDYTEFLAATLDKKVYTQEDVCWAAFRVFDQNGDGKISAEEMMKVLGDNNVPATLKDVMAEVDGDGDGMIDFKEFMMMMRSRGKGNLKVATGAEHAI